MGSSPCSRWGIACIAKIASPNGFGAIKQLLSGLLFTRTVGHDEHTSAPSLLQFDLSIAVPHMVHKCRFIIVVAVRYAFVNFVSPVFAEHFRSVYQAACQAYSVLCDGNIATHVQGLALAGDRSKKICAVAPATTQGRQRMAMPHALIRLAFASKSHQKHR